MTQGLSEAARGIYIISATPFDDEGRLDLESADSLTDFYLAAGVDGITLLGVMGEAPKLTGEEARSFISRVLRRVRGRVPVVVGVTNPGLQPLRELAAFSMEEGAAGVMIAPPPGLLGDEAVRNWLSQAIETVGAGTPVCIQDFPPANGIHIAPSLVTELTRRHPSFVMFKAEDHPGLNKLTRVRADAEAGKVRRLSILTGNGGVFLPMEIERGSDGAMTGFAFPELLVTVRKRLLAGDRKGAYDLFDAYLPIVRFEQQPVIGIAIRKEILRRRGAIRCAKVRAPGPVLNAKDQEEISFLLSRLPKEARAILASGQGIEA